MPQGTFREFLSANSFRMHGKDSMGQGAMRFPIWKGTFHINVIGQAICCDENGNLWQGEAGETALREAGFTSLEEACAAQDRHWQNIGLLPKR